jgi:hypothetical protein
MFQRPTVGLAMAAREVTMFEDEAEDLDDQITSLVARRLKEKNQQLVSPDNEAHYTHGGAWTHIDAATGGRDRGAFEEHSAETATPLSAIVDNHVEVLPRFIEDMAERMHGQVARSLFEMIGAAARDVGNEATFKTGEGMSDEEEDAMILAGIDAVLEKLEFGVDRHGVVSRPQMHISPDNSKMIRALKRKMALGPDEAVEERMNKKEGEAIAREVDRLRLFKRS